MASELPNRLLSHNEGHFFVFDPRPYGVTEFDIISYHWGDTVDPYECRDVEGVTWTLVINPKKLNDIKRWMIASGVRYLWADCVCINQGNEEEKAVEISRMYEYYKSAKQCHILLDMVEVWNPQEIVEDLSFIDNIIYQMRGFTMAAQAGLTKDLTDYLAVWGTQKEWVFGIDRATVWAAAIEPGLLNCYSTCIRRVQSVFANAYFTRVWTFQEMLLGRNIIMWGINEQIKSIGLLETWMDFVHGSTYKLQSWIEMSRVSTDASVEAVLMAIMEDNITLKALRTHVRGIISAKTDIISGGSWWWVDNHRGISNVFSTISMVPRRCTNKADIFRGLVGVFSGLFTSEEIKTELTSDIDKASFAFFRQLSIKTGRAWTKLAISSGKRGEWDWIPVVADYPELTTTDIFSAVVKLGVLIKGQPLVKAQAITGIEGNPRKYMDIKLSRASPENEAFHFNFQGCNCGKKIKTGKFSSEPIPTNTAPRTVVRDETGRILVQCATLLGWVLDPDCNIIEYRRRLLSKLQPYWRHTDPNTKPPKWIDRCASGSFCESPHYHYFRSHNMSMHYTMPDITGCGSRLHNETTKNISCEIRVNCGCTIKAPFSLIFDAITSIAGSSIGDMAALDQENRIVLQDGLGLVQVGDLGKSFSLVAFGGDSYANASYASICRSKKMDQPAIPMKPWPRGRALVRAEFEHNKMRDYGYVETGGSGNLLICRNNPMDDYRIVGVCIDEFFLSKKGIKTVKVQ